MLIFPITTRTVYICLRPHVSDYDFIQGMANHCKWKAGYWVSLPVLGRFFVVEEWICKDMFLVSRRKPILYKFRWHILPRMIRWYIKVMLETSSFRNAFPDIREGTILPVFYQKGWWKVWRS